MRFMLLVSAAALALPTAAYAQNIGEEGGYQFKTPEERIVDLQIEQTRQIQENGGFSMLGGFGGGGSPLGSAANTNNVFQFIDQSVTTNNCSSSGAVGAPITCGGHGGNTVSGTNQTSTGNTQNASNDIKDNTLNNNSSNTTNVGETIHSTNNPTGGI
jgi:hypothetical protein